MIFLLDSTSGNGVKSVLNYLAVSWRVKHRKTDKYETKEKTS